MNDKLPWVLDVRMHLEQAQSNIHDFKFEVEDILKESALHELICAEEQVELAVEALKQAPPALPQLCRGLRPGDRVLVNQGKGPSGVLTTINYNSGGSYVMLDGTKVSSFFSSVNLVHEDET